MQLIRDIEQILADWNPIGVPEEIALSEYGDYAPRLAKQAGDEVGLTSELESILVEVIGLPYDPQNMDHKSDLLAVVRAIQKVNTVSE